MSEARTMSTFDPYSIPLDELDLIRND
ncbi:MAG: hypothetical protein ACI9W1_003658, partial [Candidatus Azotimanducaceae bacterium]